MRDAIYDQILLSEPELALISTNAFLRLDRIQQLGFVSRIWPGARHARYDHSLGVMHLTRLAIDHLRRTTAGDLISDEEARVYSAAALLHDIGHYPFSHAIEELGPPVLPHEAVGSRIIEQGAVAEILREQWQIEPARVSEVISPPKDLGMRTGSICHCSRRISATAPCSMILDPTASWGSTGGPSSSIA